MTTNDELKQLLAATARGDRDRFHDLYRQTSSVLFAVALKVLRDRPLAEDVLQETFVQIWHRAGEYHADRGTVMVWLTTLVRYRAIDVIRKRRTPLSKRLADTEMAEQNISEDDPKSPLGAAMAGQEASHVRDCLKHLNEKQQRSIYLAFFRGLTHLELAQYLAEPLGTVKARVRRGLFKLKTCLQQYGGSLEILG